MKLNSFFSAVIVIGLLAGNAYAQHSDVEFGYDNLSSPGSIVIEASEFTSDGIIMFEAEFEELDPFNPGDFSADEPGFTTNDLENLLVNTGDQVWIRALDASTNSAFGVGFVNYYNPMTDALEASGRIEIEGNFTDPSDFLVLDGASITGGNNPQFLGTGDADGDVHDHVIFDLLDDPTAPLGAYGVLLQLQSDFDPADGNMDVDSDPFWVIFNHGLSESQFEDFALPAFGASSAVPEPGTGLLLLFGSAAMGLRRRRSA